MTMLRPTLVRTVPALVPPAVPPLVEGVGAMMLSQPLMEVVAVVLQAVPALGEMFGVTLLLSVLVKMIWPMMLLPPLSEGARLAFHPSSYVVRSATPSLEPPELPPLSANAPPLLRRDFLFTVSNLRRPLPPVISVNTPISAASLHPQSPPPPAEHLCAPRTMFRPSPILTYATFCCVPGPPHALHSHHRPSEQRRAATLKLGLHHLD